MLDLVALYQFVRKLVTPFKKMPAYKAGIIDDKGKFLKKKRDLKTAEEKKALSYFDILIINLKKLLAKIPGGGTQLATFTAALMLLREYESKSKSLHMLSESDLSKEFFDTQNEVIEFDLMNESAPANAVGTGANVAGVTGTPPVFAGKRVYQVNLNTFVKARLGKKKYSRWDKMIDDEKLCAEIKKYAHRNPKEDIILQQGPNGPMLYLIKRDNKTIC